MLQTDNRVTNLRQELDHLAKGLSQEADLIAG